MMEIELFFLDWKAFMAFHLTNPYQTRNIYTCDISYNRYQTIMLTINRCQIIM